ncbi:MAG TPA: hypothetical protein VK249_26995 [Anaerolineales bacterium]|nr:hypothetical protein [Anaerolineales bacterium]
MFNLFKKAKPTPSIEIRDTLFGDMPISDWPGDPSLKMEPWISFVQARKHLDKRDQASAIASLQKITEMPGDGEVSYRPRNKTNAESDLKGKEELVC